VLAALCFVAAAVGVGVWDLARHRARRVPIG